MSSDTPPSTNADHAPLLRVEGLRKHFDTENSLLDRLFGDTSDPVRAVDDIDFEIQRGETMGLVGESGCGKSTTGETILQLLEPTSGLVEYDGENLVEKDDLQSFRQRTGVVFQDPFSSLDPRMTIGAIVKQPLDIHGWPWLESDVETTAVVDTDGVEPTVSVADDIHRVDGIDPIDGRVTVELTIRRQRPGPSDEQTPESVVIGPYDDEAFVRVHGEAISISTEAPLELEVTGGDVFNIDVRVGRSDEELRRERVQRLLERVGLSSDQFDRYPHEFSGGQRQRIGIARALALDPDFLVLDEPTSALDVSVQAQVLNLLVDLKEEFGLTYLIISHDLSVIRHVCDRVAVMYLGELVEVASADDLFSSPKHPYTKALLESVPRPDVSEQERKIETLAGDVPSPRSPPSGCRFRTRCPKVIPSDQLALEQSEYRAVMDVRDRIAKGAITPEEVGEEDTMPTPETLLEHLIDVELPGEHKSIVLEALDLFTDDKVEEAAMLLQEHYESVCERENPELQGDEHSVACHLHWPPAE